MRSGCENFVGNNLPFGAKKHIVFARGRKNFLRKFFFEKVVKIEKTLKITFFAKKCSKPKNTNKLKNQSD